MRTPLGHDLLNMKKWYICIFGWLRLLALILLALCQSMVADQERSLKNISFLDIVRPLYSEALVLLAGLKLRAKRLERKQISYSCIRWVPSDRLRNIHEFIILVASSILKPF